ncbi:MAG: hypothetical protein V4584_07115 [Verrucomicrobiota bacterium]
MNCPFCKRLLYSRQHKNCGYCGQELPERFRLSEEEIEEIKAENRAIEERRAFAKAEEAAEAERKRRDQRRNSGF